MSRPHPTNHPEIKAGARWWKIDFHTHTNHSSDAYNDGYSDKEWLLAHMRKEIDAVCVTDHNGGRQIDLLKEAYLTMEDDFMLEEETAEEDFRPLTIFPGVELTTLQGYHCLVILDPLKGTSEISQIIGQGPLNSVEGDAEAKWNNTPTDLNLQAFDALIIPAHIDGPKGLYYDQIIRHPGVEEQPATSLQIDPRERLRTLEALAPKVMERHRWSQSDPTIDGFAGIFVYGSDSHNYEHIGIRTTWVKMEEPSLEALKIALADGYGSVRECKTPQPPAHASRWITKILLKDTKHLGRTTPASGGTVPPLELLLNPGLNTIIGGRGTGKSTVIELLRKITERSEELKISDELHNHHVSLLEESIDIELPFDCSISFHYLQTSWTKSYSTEGYKLTKRDENGEDITISLDPSSQHKQLPLSIYSQKQLYHFRKDTSRLLKQIDNSDDVSASSIERILKDSISNSINLLNNWGRINEQIKTAKEAKVELDEVNKQITLFEDSNNAKILTAFSVRETQGREIVEFLNHSSSFKRSIENLITELTIPELKLTHPKIAEQDYKQTDVESYSKILSSAYQAALEKLKTVQQELDDSDKEWNRLHFDSEWQTAHESAQNAYKGLVENATEQDEEFTFDPATYKTLVEKREKLTTEVNKLTFLQLKVDEIKEQYADYLTQFRENRQLLTTKRQEFIESKFGSHQKLNLNISQFGDKRHCELSLRSLLHKLEGYSEDFNAILDCLYQSGAPSLEKINDLKDDLKAARKKSARHKSEKLELVFGKRFCDHISTMTQEDLIRLSSWFPNDKLVIQLQKNDKTGYINIDKASPGQVATAVLAFLLSYGEDPLILDQPEDDLDNKMIYDVIVKELIRTKSKRQILIVTHNANLVVNANADLILPLESERNVTTVNHSGTLQNKGVREQVCSIMEGGPEALRQRFERILK